MHADVPERAAQGCPPAGCSPRIAMFINSFQRGGAERQFVHVARALVAAGCQVRIFVLLADNDFGDLGPELPVQLLAPAPGIASLTEAVRQLRRWHADAVVSFLYQATVAGRIAAKLAGVPVVVSSMRNERLETRARTLLYRATGAVDTATVTNSERAAQTLERERTVRPGSLRIIPNGLDLTPFDTAPAPTLRAELALDDSTFLFLGMGRLAPQKDWPTLIDAVRHYDGPPAHWAIAGGGPDESALRSTIAGAGLSDRISLLGLRDDNIALLAACDALVLSSRYEGLPNVVLEAMAAGRPVVATRVGGCPELVRPECGVLVEPGDAGQLAEAMAGLAARPLAARAAMGVVAQERVRREFALDVANRRWVELVCGLVAERSRHLAA